MKQYLLCSRKVAGSDLEQNIYYSYLFLWFALVTPIKRWDMTSIAALQLPCNSLQFAVVQL